MNITVIEAKPNAIQPEWMTNELNKQIKDLTKLACDSYIVGGRNALILFTDAKISEFATNPTMLAMLACAVNWHCWAKAETHEDAEGMAFADAYYKVAEYAEYKLNDDDYIIYHKFVD